MITFTVYGKPQPAGSKRAFAIRKGGVLTGKVAVTDAAKGSKSWKQEVAKAALVEMEKGGHSLMRGPLTLIVVFYVQRPASHYGTGRNVGLVKSGAPRYPAVKPDATKLVRAVEDALTSVVWADDALIVNQVVLKRYDEPERCLIHVVSAFGQAHHIDVAGKAFWL